MYNVRLNTKKREEWLKRINEAIEVANSLSKEDEIYFTFDSLIVNDLRPELIVSLACLIEYLYRKDYNMALEDSDVGRYLYEFLRFKDYWNNNTTNYSENTDIKIFNLWRIIDKQKETYGFLVKKYLVYLTDF